MDNKQAIEILKNVVMEHNSWNSGISFWDLDSAIHKAIASLEAWDKVKEDIKHSQFMFLDNKKEIECIPIFEVMNIINKYKKEVEE